MASEKISIIVPFYNSASVLDKCIQSVLHQTYTNFELVLVDDGSTDGSFALCKLYQQKDERVKLYQKKNGGVSSARNFGIGKASGTWISFLDADDFLEQNFLSGLMNTSSLCPLLVGGFKRFGDKQDEIIPDEQIVGIKDSLNTLWNKSVDKFIYWYPWGKIYRLDIIKNHNLLFNERMFYSEDFCFLLSFLSSIDSFSVRSVASYCHLYENQRAKKYKMDFSQFFYHFSCQNHVLEELETKYGHFYKLVRQNVHRRLVDNFLYNLLCIDCFGAFKTERERFKNEIDYKILLHEISTSRKRTLVYFLIFRSFPFVGYMVRHILKKFFA